MGGAVLAVEGRVQTEPDRRMTCFALQSARSALPAPSPSGGRGSAFIRSSQRDAVVPFKLAAHFWPHAVSSGRGFHPEGLITLPYDEGRDASQSHAHLIRFLNTGCCTRRVTTSSDPRRQAHVAKADSGSGPSHLQTMVSCREFPHDKTRKHSRKAYRGQKR